jgi:hypothetical protein
MIRNWIQIRIDLKLWIRAVTSADPQEWFWPVLCHLVTGSTFVNCSYSK